MATTVVLRDDSDGITHQICGQSQANSCAGASLYMIECALKAQSVDGGEDRILDLCGRGAETIHSGIDSSTTLNLLRSFGAKVYADVNTEPEKAHKGLILKTGKILDGHPAFVHIYWYIRQHGKWSVNGAHAVVAIRINTKGGVVFLDPGQGGQLFELQNDGQYNQFGNDGRIYRVFYT
ncbi:papain-like cysteine protease family protein [Methylobacterium trifolii]|uniref:papain-like cysteine protease family protein n=1 Tax=Methylobacterium trifolii TaxID=1003092 RepID=UPI001EDEDC00|nr:papain-like cysteine protease family protein [Methylobacterium trifolii]